jgi:hypothetical protein
MGRTDNTHKKSTTSQRKEPSQGAQRCPNRIQLVLSGIQNRTYGPYLAAINTGDQHGMGACEAMRRSRLHLLGLCGFVLAAAGAFQEVNHLGIRVHRHLAALAVGGLGFRGVLVPLGGLGSMAPVSMLDSHVEFKRTSARFQAGPTLRTAFRRCFRSGALPDTTDALPAPGEEQRTNKVMPAAKAMSALPSNCQDDV